MGSHWLPVLAVVAIGLLFGCDRTPPPRAAVAPTQSQAGNPVSAEVERALAAALDLAEPEKRASIQAAHADWLQLRRSHCGMLAGLERNPSPGTVAPSDPGAACLQALDKQQVSALRQIRLALLLGQPAMQRGSPTARIRLAAALDKGRSPQGIAISSDGLLAALGSTNGEVDIFDLVTGQRLRTLEGPRYARFLAFTPNSRVVLTGSSEVRGLKVWDVHSGELLSEVSEVMGPSVLLGDGRRVVYTDGSSLGVYDLATGQPIAKGFSAGSSANQVLAVDPQGAHVLSASSDGDVTLWELTPVGVQGQVALSKVTQFRVSGYEARPTTVAFSADGGRLYTANNRGEIEKWSLPSLQKQETIRLDGMSSLRLERRVNGEALILVGRRRDGQGEVMLLDYERHTGAVLQQPVAALWVSATVPGGDLLLAADTRELRTLDLPAPESAQPLGDLVARLAVEVKPANTTSQGAAVVPMLQKLPDDVRVEAIGVYEGELPPGQQRGFRERVAGTVNVSVGETPRPVALLLSSYDPVKWNIIAASRARLTTVLLSGPAESQVLGLRGVEVTRIGSAYAYQLGSRGYGGLDQASRQYTGRPIERFQGQYRGSAFAIGAAASTAIYKSVDERGVPSYGDRN